MTATDWNALVSMSDAEVMRRAKADPDAQPTTAAFWKNAVLTPPNMRKVPMTIRIDADVLAWFRSRGNGYQSLINHLMRRYMQEVLRRPPAPKPPKRARSKT